jgi:hypothetical protein
MENRLRSPESAKLRRDPDAGSAARTSSLVISARERWPASAHACRIGAIPMMWMRVVSGSRARRRGGVRLPSFMIASQVASWAFMGSGSPSVLPAK